MRDYYMKFMEHLTAKYKVEAHPTIVDTEAAYHCVEYILEDQANDYREQVEEHGLTEKTWDQIDHVYVSALKAIKKKPNPEFFNYDE